MTKSPPLPEGEGRGEGNLLPFDFTHVATLAGIPFSSATRPVIICGTRHKGLEQIRGAASSGAGLAFILDGPDAFGCALLAREHGALPLTTALASNKIKGLISFEADFSDEFPESISVIGAADWRSGSLVSQAGVFLPTTAWVEQDGTFINHEGRAQRFEKVMNPGLPIKGLDPAKHPPRVHRYNAPGGDCLPAGQIITELLRRMGDDKVEGPLTGRWKELHGLTAEDEGPLLR